jgi:signal transduction histidine kinase
MVMFCGAFLFVNTFKLYFLDYEKKIIENNRALVLMNEEKDRLFSIIAHDLRSPLSSLNQILGMLAEGNLSKEEFDVLVSKISKNAQESSELLNNLLQWASSQMKGFKIIAAPLNIQQTLNETISNVVPIAQQKNITIINEIPEDIVANVDANMIKIVFRNLLINAIKFSNKGSEIFLEATKENNNIKVFIKDQGVGIAAEDIPLLFNSLTYTKPGTENEKGTGLGLVLCKLFVERNNGTISVESRPRVGSTFCVTLPVA